MIHPHWEALTPATLRAFYQAARLPFISSFYLAGGSGLAYFADAEALPMPRMLDRTPWAKMKKFLEHEAMEAGRKNLADLCRNE